MFTWSSAVCGTTQAASGARVLRNWRRASWDATLVWGFAGGITDGSGREWWGWRSQPPLVIRVGSSSHAGGPMVVFEDGCSIDELKDVDVTSAGQPGKQTNHLQPPIVWNYLLFIHISNLVILDYIIDKILKINFLDNNRNSSGKMYWRNSRIMLKSENN